MLSPMKELSITTGPQPDEQIVFAANELKKYVSTLFGLPATISPDVQPTEAVVFLGCRLCGPRMPV